jgi:uncharacterized protein YegP (UPF0339 family)
MPKQKVNRKPGIHLHKTEQLWPTDGPAEYYWIIISKNGKTIARSSEMYNRKKSAIYSIEVASSIMTGQIPKNYFDHTGNGVEVVKF